MEITFLGTGGSYPTKFRNVPAIAVQVKEDLLLFDCGEGTQRQFMQSNVSFMNVKKIFITHFHGDHFLGLPGLLQTMAFNNRLDTLEIYGPDGIEKLLNGIFSLGFWKPSFNIVAKSIVPNEVLKFEGYSVTAELAEHIVPDYAYKVKEDDRRGHFNTEKCKALGIKGKDFSCLEYDGFIIKNGKKILLDDVTGNTIVGKSLVYTGDTVPSDRIAKFSNNVDILIHEASVTKDLENKANEYGHSSSSQAAEIAVKANAKQLILTHISPRYEDATPLLEEAQTIMKNTKLAEDFLVHVF
jgi:ribonuclease Z